MDFLLSILETNINYNSIIVIILIYIVLLWVMLSLWVAMDAKRRYNKMLMGVIFFFVVLVLNIPALVFYLIVRPEREEDNILYLHSDDAALGGVNVPIVNFTGKDGFVVSLQLKIGNTNADNQTASNMNINVDWQSNDPEMKVSQVAEQKKETKQVAVVSSQEQKAEPANPVQEKVKGKVKNVAKKVKNVTSKFMNSVQSYAETLDQEVEKKPDNHNQDQKES